MKVSIIITTKNEEAVIGHLLESIVQQTWKHREIIVVDNQSTDNTISIAKKYTKNIYTKGPERSAQRNFGASKSTGDILLFLDADMILTKTVVSDCVSSFYDKKYQALVVPEQSIGQGFWSHCKIFERSCYLGIDWIESARVYRKNLFNELKGYDETLSGPEDFDLPQRLKYRCGSQVIGRIPSFIIHNEGSIHFFDLLKKKFYYGKSLKKYMRKKENQRNLSQQANPLKRYVLFFRYPRVFVLKPHIFLGTIVMKTLELVALYLGSKSSNPYEDFKK